LALEAALELRVGGFSGLEVEASVFDPFFKYGIGPVFRMGKREKLKGKRTFFSWHCADSQDCW
jgi:hypothetical protein